MLTQIYEAASGSYVALRINLVILKELNLGNLGNVDCKGSQYTGKGGMVSFMRVSEN